MPTQKQIAERATRRMHVAMYPWAIMLSDFTKRRCAGPPHWKSPTPPATSGVYALLGTEDEPWYIGMSCDISRRLKQHWFPRFGEAWYETDESTARMIEKILIETHRPRFNIRMTDQTKREIEIADASVTLRERIERAFSHWK